MKVMFTISDGGTCRFHTSAACNGRLNDTCNTVDPASGLEWFRRVDGLQHRLRVRWNRTNGGSMSFSSMGIGTVPFKCSNLTALQTGSSSNWVQIGSRINRGAGASWVARAEIG